ncbi:hypothetical protein ABZ468_25870 [Streptomyces sp. NPDC005708]|uniref:hypothetical protein n=1 Tax=Streptomyces sp. NPDC005708 TaxID=3154564 RepID=UPI0033F53FE6
MSATRTGRDGRPLVTTDQAAYSLSMRPGQFRAWVSRHGLRPAGHRPDPRRGQPLALWDLTDITAATNPDTRVA